MTPDNSDTIQGRFQKGQSGNPAGKPKGARHKTTLAVQALLDGEGEAIARRAVEAAKAGDMVAIRLILERVLPARKDVPISFTIPDIHTAADINLAMAAIIEAVAGGELTPCEAESVAGLVELQRKAIETKVLEQRIIALEKKK